MKRTWCEVRDLNQNGDFIGLREYTQGLLWHELAEEIVHAARYGLDVALDAYLIRADIGIVNARACVSVKGGELWVTPLIAAASCGHPECVSKLLAHGAVHSLVDDANCSALRHACVGYCNAVISGAQRAWRNAYMETAQTLVDHFAKHAFSLDTPDPDGGNALSEACSIRGSSAIIKILLRHGADPNFRTGGGMTPLMYAADAGDKHVCRLLLKAGADPSLRNRQGKSASDLARLQDRRDVEKMLRV